MAKVTDLSSWEPMVGMAILAPNVSGKGFTVTMRLEGLDRNVENFMDELGTYMEGYNLKNPLRKRSISSSTIRNHCAIRWQSPRSRPSKLRANALMCWRKAA